MEVRGLLRSVGMCIARSLNSNSTDMDSLANMNPVERLLGVLCDYCDDIDSSLAYTVYPALAFLPVVWLETADEVLQQRVLAVRDRVIGAVQGSVVVTGSTELEKVVAREVRNILEGYPSCEMFCNVWLHGFEADLVVRTGSGCEINIEVDGPSHALPTKRLFCYRRDEVLSKRHGVVVIRVDYKDVLYSGRTDLWKERIVSEIERQRCV